MFPFYQSGVNPFVATNLQQSLDIFSQPEEEVIHSIYSSDNIIDLGYQAILAHRKISPEIQRILFTQLVKNHILYRDEFMEAPCFNISPSKDSEDYICTFINSFPQRYRDIFRNLDNELFENIIRKPLKMVWGNEINNSPFNLVQVAYFYKSVYNDLIETLHFYNEFESSINADVQSDVFGFHLKTNFFEHFIRNITEDTYSCWDVFAPLTPQVSHLSPHLQELFTFAALTELFKDFEDGHGNSIHYKSQRHSEQDVKLALLESPGEFIIKYATHPSIKEEHQPFIQQVIFNFKLDKSLPHKKGTSIQQKI